MYRDRTQAGEELARALVGERHLGSGVLVAALPRGGVPVAAPIAAALDAELDVCLVRKLGVPGQPELALGALAEGGIRVLDSGLIRGCGLHPDDVERLTRDAQAEIERRARLYRGARPAAPIKERTVMVVDDGLATGATMIAAVHALREQGAARLIVAVPVGSRGACRLLEEEGVRTVCLRTPEPFGSVGAWYRDFTQVTDEEVRNYMASARSAAAERTTNR